jgi:hypothetical protein
MAVERKVVPIDTTDSIAILTAIPAAFRLTGSLNANGPLIAPLVSETELLRFYAAR